MQSRWVGPPMHAVHSAPLIDTAPKPGLGLAAMCAHTVAKPGWPVLGVSNLINPALHVVPIQLHDRAVPATSWSVSRRHPQPSAVSPSPYTLSNVTPSPRHCCCQAATQVGRLQVVSGKQDLQAAEAAAKQPGYFVMDATDWKVRATHGRPATARNGPLTLQGGVHRCNRNSRSLPCCKSNLQQRG